MVGTIAPVASQWRLALLRQVAAAPGMTGADVRRELGDPDESFDAGSTTIQALCARGAYQPVPRVAGWHRVLVYRDWVFLQMVFLDESGVVICMTTSIT
ncbi:MAG: hypothetical protein HUU35_19545 [Armatimonadetes bacterium]|nr:hypothetical protein [Armatimonadota bacterium]